MGTRQEGRYICCMRHNQFSAVCHTAPKSTTSSSSAAAAAAAGGGTRRDYKWHRTRLRPPSTTTYAMQRWSAPTKAARGRTNAQTGTPWGGNASSWPACQSRGRQHHRINGNALYNATVGRARARMASTTSNGNGNSNSKQCRRWPMRGGGVLVRSLGPLHPRPTTCWRCMRLPGRQRGPGQQQAAAPP